MRRSSIAIGGVVLMVAGFVPCVGGLGTTEPIDIAARGACYVLACAGLAVLTTVAVDLLFERSTP